MRRAFGLCVLCFIVINEKNSVVFTKTTMNLVAVLRRDLMKNNEDFDEDAPTTPEPPAAAPAPPTRRADFLQPNKLLQVDNAATPYEPETFTFEIQQFPAENSTTEMSAMNVDVLATHSKPRHKNTTTSKSEAESSSAARRIRPTAPSAVRPTLVDDAAGQHSLLFNEALRQKLKKTTCAKKKVASTPFERGVPTFTGRPEWPVSKPGRQERPASKPGRQEWPASKPGRQERPASKPRPPPARQLSDEVSQDEGSPHAAQLDMLPAVGGRIHEMRLKNRICDRNVLINEGPKYDYRGKTRGSTNKSALFGSTPRPRYVLPRCCNCCRKSLLGCE